MYQTEEIVQYILRFMIGDISRFVGYTADTTRFADYKVVIIPSDFFNEGVYGTMQTQLVLPLKNIEGIPFLFGMPNIERVGNTIVVYADLVASAYFLLTRYEELINTKRDEFGRFPGRESLPYRAGFIDRPIVDEYGKLIRSWLNQAGVETQKIKPSIRKINLTNDVDFPFYCRTWRNVVREIFSGKSITNVICAKFSPLENDFYYTFPWIFQQNKILQDKVGESKCQSLLFFRSGGKSKQDKPLYDLKSKDIQTLFVLCREQKAVVGLHSSYHSGIHPALICNEKKKLEEAFGTEIKCNRHHFLTAREPEDMEYLIKAGITDDYTMGYADVAGFRLGTSLPVRFINPATKRLTSLRLHPLTIMDCTLSEKKYMNLTADKAEEYCLKLIRNIRNVNGELTLLWHNTSIIENNGDYLRDLYSKLIQELMN
jgi:hypothetical protein